MIHHLTILGRKADRLKKFYGDVLGLSLLEETFSRDDPATPHLIFGTPQGKVLLTFLLYPRSHRGLVGSGSVGSVEFAVPAGSLQEWRRRLRSHKVVEQEGRLSCVGPDGLSLGLVEGDGRIEALSLRSVEVLCSEECRQFLGTHLGASGVLRFGSSDVRAELGYGSVHHVAMLCPGGLEKLGVPGVSPVKERDGFRSRYFHDPDDGLWELVSEGKGT